MTISLETGVLDDRRSFDFISLTSECKGDNEHIPQYFLFTPISGQAGPDLGNTQRSPPVYQR